MIKKLFFVPLLVVSMVYFVQCTDEYVYSGVDEPDTLSESKGKKPDNHGEETTGNNLSFPVIAADNFSITQLSTPSFAVLYTGEYPGLTEAEIALLEASGPWYPQKTEGNGWQADFQNAGGSSVEIDGIDWGDVIEVKNPVVRRPFRLEVTLYKNVDAMTAYEMAVLEYPSSLVELQGTNNKTYESSEATVVSSLPKLVIQDITGYGELNWDDVNWVWVTVPEDQEEDPEVPEILDVAFGPELNVGGKYIYGASSGGWKPTFPGWYRLTFYLPGSNIDVSGAVIKNVPSENPLNTAVVDATNNITYIDVEVLPRNR